AIPDFELGAILRPLRDFELVRHFEGGHFDFRAEGRLRDVQGDGAVQVVFVAFEERVRLYLEEYIQISRGSAVAARLAFAGEPQPHAIVYAGRDVDLQFALDLTV